MYYRFICTGLYVLHRFICTIGLYVPIGLYVL